MSDKSRWRGIERGPDLPATTPLGAAAQRKRDTFAQAQRDRMLRQRADAAAGLVAWAIEYGREQREQAALEQRRRDMEEEIAFLEWLMHRRPEPPSVPVPDEPRWTLFNRPPRMNYEFRPRNGY